MSCTKAGIFLGLRVIPSMGIPIGRRKTVETGQIFHRAIFLKKIPQCTQDFPWFVDWITSDSSVKTQQR